MSVDPVMEAELVHELASISHFYKSLLAEVALPKGFTETRLCALQLSLADKGIAFSTLGKLLRLSTDRTSKLADWLVQNRLAKIVREGNDHRFKLLKATRVGRDYAERIDNHLVQRLLAEIPGPYGRKGRVSRALNAVRVLHGNLVQATLMDGDPNFGS